MLRDQTVNLNLEIARVIAAGMTSTARCTKSKMRGAEILRSLTWYTLLLMSCLQQSHVQFPDLNLQFDL